MPNIPGATLSPDKTQVVFSICVDMERHDDDHALARVSIGGIEVWTGFVTWDESPMMVGENVEWFGPIVARQRGAKEAIQRWTGRW